MKTPACSLLPGLLTLTFAAAATAAPITFVTPATISGVTDVATAGTGVFAYDWSTTQTVNGVTFTKITATNGTAGPNLSLAGFGSTNATAFTATAAPFTNLDAAYKAMLVGAVYNATLGATGTVTLPGLTTGRQYQVQLWVSDPRTGATTTRVQTINGANSVPFDFNVGNILGANGQVASGYFTADGGTNAFTLSSLSTPTALAGLPQMNAIQLRDVTNIGWWSGTSGSAWDAAATPNFSIDGTGSAGTFAAAKALLPIVTFADTQTLGGTPVGTGTVEIAAGGVTGASVAFINTAAQPYTINSADATGISGPHAVSVQGGGQVTFSGSNTYTGGTTVTSGKLVLNNSAALAATSSLSMGNAATASVELGAPLTIGALSGGGAAGGNINLQANTLTVGDSTNSTYGGAFIGTGGLTKQGAGALTLSGTSLFSGPASVTQGRLNVTGSAANSDVSMVAGTELGGEGRVKSLTLAGNTLYVDPATPGAFTAAAGLSVNGTNNVNLTGIPSPGLITVLNYGGTLNGSAANFNFVNSAGFRSATFADTGTAITLDLGTATRTWNGTGTTWETGGIETDWVEGDQKFISGDSVIFGPPAGPQTVTLVGALSPGSVAVTTSAGNDWTFSGGTIASGSLTKSGEGTLTLTSANTYAGGTTINGGTVLATLSNLQNAIGTGPAFVAAGATLQFNSTTTTNVTANPGNVFTGSGLLRMNFSAGTTARNSGLGNVNGFTGTIQLSAGGATGDKWNVAGASAPGASVIVDSGTQLFLASGVNTFAGVSLTGTGNSENRGAMRIIGTLNAPVTLGGSTTIGTEGGTINGSITPVNAGAQTLTLGTTASTGALVINGVISDGAGTLSLTKVAAGVSTLLGANTYSGTTLISAGTIQIGNAATTAVTNSASTLNPGTGLTGTLGSAPVTNNGTLDFRRSDTSYIVTNDISGTGAVNVNGVAGSIVTLSGNNSFSGAVTIGLGGLRITRSNSLGSGTKTITMTNGTAGQPSLRLDGSGGDISLPSTFSFTTSSSAGNGGIINEAGNNTIAGNFNLIAGGGPTRVRVDGGTLTLSGNVTAGTTLRALILDGAANGTFSGALTDNGANIPGLTKEGAGTWTLTGASTYTGTTSINRGLLLVNGSLGNTATTVGASGILGGSGSITGTVTADGTIAPGNSAGTLTTGTTTLNGTLAVEVDGAAADKLMVTGNLTLGAASAVNVALLGGGFTAASYVIAECTGTLSGTFASVPAGYQVTYTATTAVLSKAAPAGYAAWAAGKGLDGTPGKEAGFTDDPDRDGLQNGIEFVVDGDPLSGSSSGLPVTAIQGANLVITYTRRDDAEYLNPVLQFDTDLVAPWTTVTDPAHGTISVQENGAAPDTVTVTIPMSTAPRLFVRLFVTGP